MLPLKKTIDHVSPQNLNQDNKDSDINLVESCYTCNHDLKQGMTFREFYSMFPSIQKNMPSEKFKYAYAGILDSSQSNITFRLSASNLLKHLNLLFTQKREAKNELQSLDYRIKNCEGQINDAVESCKSQISDKKARVSELKDELDELQKDPEFNAIIERNNISYRISDLDSSTANILTKRQRASNSINELRNDGKKKKKENKTSVKLTPEEKKEKIDSLKSAIVSYNEQINMNETKKQELQQRLHDLDSEYPSVETIQNKKYEVDNIIKAHQAVKENTILLKDNENSEKEASEQEKSLKERLAQYSGYEKFDISEYPEEDKSVYERYISLKESEEYIDSHPNGGELRVLIKQLAMKQIKNELETIEKTDVIQNYKKASEYSTLDKELQEVQKKRKKLEEEQENYKIRLDLAIKNTQNMPLKEAESKNSEYSESIRRLTQKNSRAKIPSIINKIEAEILMLEITVKDLLAKQEEISE